LACEPRKFSVRKSDPARSGEFRYDAVVQSADLILTLTASLGAAAALGFATHKLGLSPIVGYLVAGFLVGPNTPGYTANQEIAGELAEIGVILLMFGIGLQFHIKELLSVWKIAVIGALGQSLVATLLGTVLGRALGWPWSAGIVFGLAISVASTVVLVRVLADNKDLHTSTGRIAVGWLVVEDLFTVFVLVLLPALAEADSSSAGAVAWSFTGAVFKLSVLVAFTFVVGGRVIPWLLAVISATRSRELFTLSVLVMALGIAVGSAKLFGASMALGAFLAGLVVGRSDFSLRAASDALPMRDAFAVLFFVSVGMLFRPSYLWDSPGLVFGTLGVILLGKPIAAFVIMLLKAYPARAALALGAVLAQIGEFSFILGRLGLDLGLISPGVMNAMVAAAIVSITLNPILYRAIDPFHSWATRRIGFWRRLTDDRKREALSTPGESEVAETSWSDRAIIVGYGPVGRTLTRLLQVNRIVPTIVEMNLDTVRELRAQGMEAHYGDATRLETLQMAGAETAASLILTASGMKGIEETIRVARELNPDIRVLVRSNYLREFEPLQRLGADVVLCAEGEVAMAMTESLLRWLGSTPEQIDRERDRIRTELFQTAPAPSPA
jgi:CPA2 family monovalent cation:H+ antiporter-2